MGVSRHTRVHVCALVVLAYLNAYLDFARSPFYHGQLFADPHAQHEGTHNCSRAICNLCVCMVYSRARKHVTVVQGASDGWERSCLALCPCLPKSYTWSSNGLSTAVASFALHVSKTPMLYVPCLMRACLAAICIAYGRPGSCPPGRCTSCCRC